MPSTVNVAIIGLGGKGRSHAQNLATLPGVRIAGLCDVSSEAIARAQRQLGEAAADAYGTAEADRVFADPAVDAVVIATQHDSHKALAVAAAQAHKHMLVEKPLALTVEECQAIEEAVTSAGVQLLMGFQARHRHFVQLIKQRIPRPRVIVGEIIDPKWPDDFWAVDPVKGGGNVLSQGVHTFDLVSYLAGSEPLNVLARGGIFSHDPSVTPTTDTCLATIQFANGALANVTIGDFGPLPWGGDKSFYQVFDGGERSATLYGRTLLLASGAFGRAPSVEEFTAEGPGGGGQPDYQGTLNLVAEFVACVRENRPPVIAANVHDGRRATTLALRAFAAMRSGQAEAIA